MKTDLQPPESLPHYTPADEAEFQFANSLGGDGFQQFRTSRKETSGMYFLSMDMGPYSKFPSAQSYVSVHNESASFGLQTEPFQVFMAVVKELRSSLQLDAVVALYQAGLVSQSKASEMVGVSRQEFIDVLSKRKVSPIQMTDAELAREIHCE